MEMTTGSRIARRANCPPWCVTVHGLQDGEEDQVHVSRCVVVRGTPLRMCTTIDPDTKLQDGPYILVGSDEFTLGEAMDLVDVLQRLVAQGRDVTPRATAGTRSAGP
jgi:hypothetical protein